MYLMILIILVTVLHGELGSILFPTPYGAGKMLSTPQMISYARQHYFQEMLINDLPQVLILSLIGLFFGKLSNRFINTSLNKKKQLH